MFICMPNGKCTWGLYTYVILELKKHLKISSLKVPKKGIKQQKMKKICTRASATAAK